jgi:hypothetical protein
MQVETSSSQADSPVGHFTSGSELVIRDEKSPDTRRYVAFGPSGSVVYNLTPLPCNVGPAFPTIATLSSCVPVHVQSPFFADVPGHARPLNLLKFDVYDSKSNLPYAD